MAAIPYDTAWSFVHRKKAKQGAFRTDGTTIWSYGLALAVWDKDGITRLVPKETKRSRTTAIHMKALNGVLEEIRKGEEK